MDDRFQRINLNKYPRADYNSNNTTTKKESILTARTHRHTDTFDSITYGFFIIN